MEVSWEATFKNRVIQVFLCILAVFAVIFCKQFMLQYVDHSYYKEFADDQQINSITLKATRGEIRDTNGQVLATSRNRQSIAMRPNEVKNPVLFAQTLSGIINMPASEIIDMIAEGGIYVYLERKASDEACKRIQAIEADSALRRDKDPHYVGPLDGIALENELHGKRYYPKGRLASHIIGGAGMDENGLGGIEASYDEVLAGCHGRQLVNVDVDGNSIPTMQPVGSPMVDGKNVVLTIDERIQYVVEQELAKQVSKHKAAGGICVVMNAKDASILSLAIMPDFDPNQCNNVKDAIKTNRALTNPYEPGSIFKIFTTMALMNSGFSPNDYFANPDPLMVDGVPISNDHPGNPSETAADILAYSFNTGTASEAFAVGYERYRKELHKMGLDRETNIELPGESAGIIDTTEPWTRLTLANVSFGQGICVTPIQIVSAVQGICNGGVRLQPHVVKAIVDNNGHAEVVKPKKLSQMASKANADKVLQMMAGIVSYGTGKQGRVPGYRTGGKTGTAQVAVNGTYDTGLYNSGFLGVAPIDNPEIIVLVKIEYPRECHYGGVVAAPVFQNVCAKVLPLLGIPPMPGYKQTGPDGI